MKLLLNRSWNRPRPWFINTALGIVQSPEDAEDVAQEVFVQLYESITLF